MHERLKAELLAIETRLEKRLDVVKRMQAEDPLGEWSAIQEEFRQFLAVTHGEARSSKAAMAKVADMHKRSDAAKKRWESIDPIKLMDEQMELEMALTDFRYEIKDRLRL